MIYLGMNHEQAAHHKKKLLLALTLWVRSHLPLYGEILWVKFSPLSRNLRSLEIKVRYA